LQNLLIIYEAKMTIETLDMLIIGAGISGIGAAVHYQKYFPEKVYTIVESRQAIGGTWDLFRYPGIRSDSDMFTFGYKFKPWTSRKAISPGEDIRAYLSETAQEFGVDKNIRFGKRLVAANWCSDAQCWQCDIKEMASGEITCLVSRFLFICSGYYNYEQGYTPEFVGRDDFKGPIIHPQHWPEELDYAGKRVIIIGSGATALTLAPNLVKGGAKVTILQRSPTYVIGAPEEDALANRLRGRLPERWTHSIVRWKNILIQMFFYQLSKRRPIVAKRFLLGQLRRQLGAKYDINKHFTPRYNPWDQRVCLVPNGDLFRSIRDGKVTMVTDHIEQFNADGIMLQSGEQLSTDIIITATGLRMEVLKDVSLALDKQPINVPDLYNYKGVMLSSMPNFAFSVGYTNASWTLKTDLVDDYVCRLLRHMDKKGFSVVRPELPVEGITEAVKLDLQSGYVQRAMDSLPKQGNKMPWNLHMNYIRDIWALRWLRLGGLRFDKPSNASEKEAVYETRAE
jgi:monooxygenase